MLDRIEKKTFNPEMIEKNKKFDNLNSKFESKKVSIDGSYQRFPESFDKRLARMIGIEDVKEIKKLYPTIADQTKSMLFGVEKNGFKTRGLEELSKFELNSKYYATNLKQQAGFAAEILSTFKENLAAQAKGSDIITYRTDDLQGIYKRNDPLVDKVRINGDGKIIERIQTKFVGKNGNEWISKMMSKKCEKYLDGGVDKLECPKEFYDQIKTIIPQRIAKLEKQLKRVEVDGKTEVAESIRKQINKLHKIDGMVEQSNTTTGEAIFARLHPRCAAAKVFVPKTVELSHKAGIEQATFSAGLVFVNSTVDNVSSYLAGKKSAEEMVKDIKDETLKAGALGYATAFASTTASQAMKTSTKQMIQKIGNSCLPKAAIAFAVESWNSASSFAKGEIDGATLAYDLGENAAAIAGSIKGAPVGAPIGTKIGVAVGTTVGSFLGPGGAMAGASVGGTIGGVAGTVAGGLVGCALASEVYATAVECGAKNVGKISDSVQKFVDSTIKVVSDTSPGRVNEVKSAFREFAKSNKLPIRV